MNGAVGMEEVGGGSVHWFTGLPLEAWLTIAAVLFGVGMVVLALTLGGIAQQSDLKVRGWENRPKSTEGEGEWWAREYPQSEDELPELNMKAEWLRWEDRADG